MVDRRKSLHDAVIANARTRHPEILATEIPYWSDIERMTVRRAPLPAFAPASPAAVLYASLWKEIVERIGVSDPELLDLPVISPRSSGQCPERHAAFI